MPATPSDRASGASRWPTPCDGVRIVYRPSPGAYSATTPRVSMGATTTRLFTMRSRVTCAARANAAPAESESPPSQSSATLPGADGHSCGAPASRAAHPSTTASSASYSTTTRSAASCAPRRVQATTIATGSPTCIARSRTSSGWSTLIVVSPSRPATPFGSLSGATPSASRSAWVNTATTPGAAAASVVSMWRTRACACGERTIHACAWRARSTSSMNRPRPVSRAASSRRGTRAPMVVIDTPVTSCWPPRRGKGGGRRFSVAWPSYAASRARSRSTKPRMAGTSASTPSVRGSTTGMPSFSRYSARNRSSSPGVHPFEFSVTAMVSES